MISRVPLRDEVYRTILTQVQRGDLPAGSRVRDGTLAQQLGVSVNTYQKARRAACKQTTPTRLEKPAQIDAA